jgi:hypothetical protein
MQLKTMLNKMSLLLLDIRKYTVNWFQNMVTQLDSGQGTMIGTRLTVQLIT